MKNDPKQSLFGPEHWNSSYNPKENEEFSDTLLFYNAIVRKRLSPARGRCC